MGYRAKSSYLKLKENTYINLTKNWCYLKSASQTILNSSNNSYYKFVGFRKN